MKKLIVLIGLLLAFASQGQAQWINNTDETSFNFVAPEHATATKNEVLFPFFKASTYTANNDTLTLTIQQHYTFYTTASDSLIANTYFYLTIDAQVTAGAMLLIEVPSGHLTRNFVPKTGFLGTTVSATSHKTKYLQFIYNGTAFIHIATMQID